MTFHPVIAAVTDRVVERSRPSRRRYLDLIEREREGGVVRISAKVGTLEAGVDPAERAGREPAPPSPPRIGTGRELFAFMRHGACPAGQGGSAMLSAMVSDIGDGAIDEPEGVRRDIESEGTDA